MIAREWTERDLAEYLLGGLPANARQQLEQEYLADPSLLERLDVAEDQLVDRYVTGRLTWWTRRRFQGHYLASPSHRTKVNSACQLMYALAPHPAAARPTPVGLALRLSYVALLLLAAGAATWFAFQNQRLGRALQAQRSLPAPAEGSSTPPVKIASTPVAAFVLYPRTFRAIEEERRLEIPGGTGSVELRLFAPSDTSQSYTATLTRLNGAQIAIFDAKRENRQVRVTLPAASLTGGTYLLRLQSVENDFQETYQFSAVKKPV
jgi:hypothetical protein